MEKNQTSKINDIRNEYIDFLRGIAALGIIAIHTAFWSGQQYTPEWFWNITLFLDVPFFFYLSGWASSYHDCNIIRTCKGLGKIWIKYIFFISVIAIFCAVSCWLPVSFQGGGVENLRDFYNNCVFNMSFSEFPVMAGSMWFIPYYFVTHFVNSIVLTCLKKSNEAYELQKWYMWMLVITFIWASSGKYLFGLDMLYFLFYGAFWMFGFNRIGLAKNKGRAGCYLALCLLGFGITSYIQSLPIYDIQSAKFPPSLKYGFASMFSIIIAQNVREYISHFNRFIVHIGRNAIFYYFAQGIGSSICYHIVSAISINNWFTKWCIVFGINMAMTVCISESLRELYRIVARLLLKKSKEWAGRFKI